MNRPEIEIGDKCRDNTTGEIFIADEQTMRIMYSSLYCEEIPNIEKIN